MPEHVDPDPALPAFHCPFCGVYALQVQRRVYGHAGPSAFEHLDHYRATLCGRCGQDAMWVNRDGKWSLIHPTDPNGAKPSGGA